MTNVVGMDFRVSGFCHKMANNKFSRNTKERKIYKKKVVNRSFKMLSRRQEPIREKNTRKETLVVVEAVAKGNVMRLMKSSLLTF